MLLLFYLCKVLQLKVDFFLIIYMLKLSVQNILHCYCTVVFAVSFR